MRLNVDDSFWIEVVIVRLNVDDSFRIEVAIVLLKVDESAGTAVLSVVVVVYRSVVVLWGVVVGLGFLLFRLLSVSV